MKSKSGGGRVKGENERRSARKAKGSTRRMESRFGASVVVMEMRIQAPPRCLTLKLETET